MKTIDADNTENPEKLDVHTFTEELMRSYYPPLFLKLNLVSYLLQDLNGLPGKDLLLSIHQRMNDELTEIYRKEKLFLFPLLLQLEKEHKTSNSCKPFKNVKYHYTYLVSTTQQFKTLLNKAISEQRALKELHELKDHVELFEQELVKMQYGKEQGLFKKFRNCSGNCKSL